MKTYQESLKVYRDNYNVLEYAKKEGREQGKLEGRKEGREEGKLEERIEIARRFKQKGIDIDIIAETTGLSREELEKL
jgi:predicted transposase/invertase (TIGR01784 family)